MSKLMKWIRSLELRPGRSVKWLAPGYGACVQCETPWLFAQPHTTEIIEGSGIFALCEPCWKGLGSALPRMGFYRHVVVELWRRPEYWPTVQTAVFREDGLVLPEQRG